MGSSRAVLADPGFVCPVQLSRSPRISQRAEFEVGLLPEACGGSLPVVQTAVSCACEGHAGGSDSGIVTGVAYLTLVTMNSHTEQWAVLWLGASSHR